MHYVGLCTVVACVQVVAVDVPRTRMGGVTCGSITATTGAYEHGGQARNS